MPSLKREQKGKNTSIDKSSSNKAGGRHNKTNAFNAKGQTTAFDDGSRYNNLIPSLAQNPFKHQFSYYGSTRSIRIQQFPAFGIGGVLWDCELVLAMFLHDRAIRFKESYVGATFLELGAGTGLAAIMAWLLGGVAIATDLPDVVTAVTNANVTINIEENRALSARRQQIAAANLAWGQTEDIQQCQALLCKMAGRSSPPKFDYIIAADVIYHSEQHQPLLQTLGALMYQDNDKGTTNKEKNNGGKCSKKSTSREKGTKFIFVHRRRFENDTNFVEPLLSLLQVESQTPVCEVVPAYPKDNLTIYVFTARDNIESIDQINASKTSNNNSDVDGKEQP